MQQRLGDPLATTEDINQRWEKIKLMIVERLPAKPQQGRQEAATSQQRSTKGQARLGHEPQSITTSMAATQI
ncbi:hypothetical protein FCV25MIE_09731 [Fagus crenata]